MYEICPTAEGLQRYTYIHLTFQKSLFCIEDMQVCQNIKTDLKNYNTMYMRRKKKQFCVTVEVTDSHTTAAPLMRSMMIHLLSQVSICQHEECSRLPVSIFQTVNYFLT
jgi:hypothetical protein